MKCGEETRSLPGGLSPLDVTLAAGAGAAGAAQGAAAAAAARKEPLKVFEASPVTGKPVQLLAGRYGPYVTDGVTNASLPRGTAPEEVTLEYALNLLEGAGGTRSLAAAVEESRREEDGGGKESGPKKAVKKKTAQEEESGMRSMLSDTHPDAERFQLDLIRKMTVAERLARAAEWTAIGGQHVPPGTRPANPAPRKRELDLLWMEQQYGRDLAVRLRNYLQERPPCKAMTP